MATKRSLELPWKIRKAENGMRYAYLERYLSRQFDIQLVSEVYEYYESGWNTNSGSCKLRFGYYVDFLHKNDEKHARSFEEALFRAENDIFKQIKMLKSSLEKFM
jgi:hypothetical protein